MSSLDQTNAKDAAASTSPDHDPALERQGSTDDALAPPALPAPAGGQPSGDGGLHLQNAHYGALDVETPNADGQDPSTDDATPAPPAVDPTTHPDVPSLKPDAANAAAGAGFEQELPGAARNGTAPTTNSQFASNQSASFAAGDAPAPRAAAPKVSAPAQATALAEDANEAPTDIALSNATIDENAAGAVVGTLTTVDPDAGDHFTYAVSDDRFEVVDGQLKLKDGVSLDHESEPLVTISVTSTDSAGHSITESFTITIANVNETPTDVALSSATVSENAAGAVVGLLSTVDPDAGDSHAYSVSDDRFEVVGGQLKLKDGVSLDHEAEPSVTVQVTSTDAGGLSISENFTITVENVNESPTDIALSNATVEENAAGAVVGTLTTADPDGGDSHAYTVSDNRFEVVDGQLKLKDGVSLDHEAEPNVAVQVTSTDAGGLSITETFTVEVQNVNEAPTDIALSNATVAENQAGAVIGTLSSSDPDAGDTQTYTVSDSRFEVVAGQLKLKAGVSLDYEAAPSVSIDVTATDSGGLSVTESFTIAVTDVSEAIYGTNNNDTLIGTAGSDVIYALAGNDTVSAGAGNDTIVGAGGNDRLDGQDGSDTYQVGAGHGFDGFQDTGGTGVDTVVATANNVAIGLQSGFGPASGIEEISANGFAGVSVQGGSGSDTLDFSATTLTGITKIDGGAGSDTITGGGAADTIVGGAGNDTLRGGDGGDTYQIGAGHGFDRYADTGAAGTDTIVASANNVAIGLQSGFGPASGIEEISANGFAGVSVQGGSGSDTLDFSATTLTGITKIDGGAGSDTITGSAAADTIVGGAGNDTLRGGDGGDTYQVGAGHGFDRFQDTGATGTDTVTATADSVSIGLQSGFGPASGIEEISANGFAGVSILAGTGNDTLDFSNTILTGIAKIDGGAGNDTITGSAGADTIAGGAGNDTLRGGDGGDTYQVGAGHGFDRFQDTGASGVDTIVATADNVAIGLQSGFGAASGIEGISANGFAGVSILAGTGNDMLDFSTATLTGITKIDGGAGNDTITGSAGGDTIIGGAGSDTLAGGGGNDTLSYETSSAGVTVDLTANTVSGGDAQGDAISGFENVTGSAFDDVIHGDANNNVINAGAGDDRVYSSWGLDTIDAGAGSDTIDLANFNGLGDMTMDLSNGLVYFTGYVAGADHVSNFENASGTTGNDTFFGSAADNSMWGGGGNDTFHVSTGGGYDTIFGDAGSDHIRIDTGGGSGGWLEDIASGTTPVLAAGDWLLELDTGETYVLHGSGADFDFASSLSGNLTGADGSETNFTNIEGIHW